MIRNKNMASCEPCLLSMKRVPAEFYCQQCGEKYCKSCSEQHAKFRAFRGHRQIGLEEIGYSGYEVFCTDSQATDARSSRRLVFGAASTDKVMLNSGTEYGTELEEKLYDDIITDDGSLSLAHGSDAQSSQRSVSAATSTDIETLNSGTEENGTECEENLYDDVNTVAESLSLAHITDVQSSQRSVSAAASTDKDTLNSGTEENGTELEENPYDDVNTDAGSLSLARRTDAQSSQWPVSAAASTDKDTLNSGTEENGTELEENPYDVLNTDAGSLSLARRTDAQSSQRSVFAAASTDKETLNSGTEENGTELEENPYDDVTDEPGLISHFYIDVEDTPLSILLGVNGKRCLLEINTDDGSLSLAHGSETKLTCRFHSIRRYGIKNRMYLFEFGRSPVGAGDLIFKCSNLKAVKTCVDQISTRLMRKRSAQQRK